MILFSINNPNPPLRHCNIHWFLSVPIIAVRYQIAILCAITGAVAVTSFLIVQQGHRRFFTDAHQLKNE